ncbi:MAG: hypothetical protein Q8N44_03865 [Rubrivivax sp.]|nr:hypothetical protein [Rubrivivax sp.]
MKATALFITLALAAGGALAKLPPASDEAKAKAAEAAAKTAHGNAVGNFQLCKSIERVATAYHADAKKAGKKVDAPMATPACVEPAPFVYTPPAAAPAAAPTPAMAAAPAAAAAPVKK